MMHLIRYFHGSNQLEAVISQPAPFVPRVGDEFEIEETQYKVLRVVVSYPEQAARYEHLGRVVDIRVYVFPTDPSLPTALFGRMP
jgi:hypothetical protein